MKPHAFSVGTLAVALLIATTASADLALGPEEIVQAGGADLVVSGYSVPSFVHWNADDLPDLIVGEGGGLSPSGKVRIYINSGSGGEPLFTAFSYAQAGGSDLVCVASGCMGCFPRVVHWDADGRKDLLVGQSDGTLRLFLNTNTDADPLFDAGTLLQVGEPGVKTTMDVGNRAAPAIIDWNSDGRKDLAVGGYDGRIHVFLNEGTDASPDFRMERFAQESGADLSVPTARSSPCVLDLTGDGRKDLLAGNTEGQLLFYPNVGSDGDPTFSGYSFVESEGVAIDLASAARSRPFVCGWNADSVPDVLIGAGDGKVRLYQGTAITGVDAEGDIPPIAVRFVAARPNPFFPRTTVFFDLAETGHVRVSVFDAAGRHIARIADGSFGAGRGGVVWTGVDESGRLVPSCVYFVRVETAGGAATGRVSLIH